MHRTQTYTAQLRPATHTRLHAFFEQQRFLYNAALEERIGAYRKAGVSLSLSDQHKSLTALRADQEFSHYDLKGQRSCRFPLDRAFKGCCRRLKAGQTPGFPRFKSQARGMRSFSPSQPRLTSPGQWSRLALKGIGRVRFKGQVAGTVLKARVVNTPLRGVIPLGVELPDAPPNPHPPGGIDGGISARVTLSDGQCWTKNEVDRETG